MTTLPQNRIRKQKGGMGDAWPGHRSNPFIEQLGEINSKGRFRLIHDDFPCGLITETLADLNALLDESSREKRSWVSNYDPLAALSHEIEEIVRGDRKPADDIFDDRLAHTNFEHWKDGQGSRHRILLNATTKAGNLSVRFSPVCLSDSGRWEHAPEWRDIALQSGDATQRSRDEVLLIRNVHWLFEESLSRWNRQGDIDRTEQTYIAVACRAVNMAFWLTVHRLEQRFEVHLGRYIAMLSSTSEALDCLGLELVDALAEHRASVRETIAAFEANSGHSPQSFWDACGCGDALGYVTASKELRGSFGPSAKLTPSAVERFHRDLRRAIAYGIWSPGRGEQDAPPSEPFETTESESEPQMTEELSAEERPLPPGRTVRIGLVAVYPLQQPKTPPSRKRSPAQPPDYSRIARYRATEKELALAGVSSVDELVERINEFVGCGIQFPVTQSDFPNSRKKFDRLTALLAKLTWDRTASNG